MKLHNIEFLRFVFAITIVYFHIFYSNIMGFVGDNRLYSILRGLCSHAGYIVECFFIMRLLWLLYLAYCLYVLLRNVEFGLSYWIKNAFLY